MHQELASRPAKYIDPGQHELHATVLNNIRAEKTQLMIELEVLSKAINNAEATHGATN